MQGGAGKGVTAFVQEGPGQARYPVRGLAVVLRRARKTATAKRACFSHGLPLFPSRGQYCPSQPRDAERFPRMPLPSGRRRGGASGTAGSCTVRTAPLGKRFQPIPTESVRRCVPVPARARQSAAETIYSISVSAAVFKLQPRAPLQRITAAEMNVLNCARTAGRTGNYEAEREKERKSLRN